MEGEARILQQRIEPLPLCRDREHPFERVGGNQQKSIESQADECLCRQRRHQSLPFQ